MHIKSITTLITATVLVVTSHTALAEVYLGINLAKMDFKVNTVDELSFVAPSAKLGVQFHENVSAEVRLGTGITNDSVARIDVDLDSFVGAYIRAGVPIGERFYPYLMAGYAHSKVSFEVFGGGEEFSDSDFSGGIGFDIKMSERISGNVEYMNYYYNEDDANLGGFSIGITVKF